MSLSAPPPPPLLLTKRVTSFLHANLSPQIHTAALTTPAESSSRMRQRSLPVRFGGSAPLAASLWALHAPETSRFEENVEAALPSSSSSSGGGGSLSAVDGGRASAVTVQLDSGVVFVIRHLRCGMLFVCVGGSDGAAGSSARGTHGQGHGFPLQQGTAGPDGNGTAPISPPLGSPSEAGSILSAGTIGAATTTSHTTTGSILAGMSPTLCPSEGDGKLKSLRSELDGRRGSIICTRGRHWAGKS